MEHMAEGPQEPACGSLKRGAAWEAQESGGGDWKEEGCKPAARSRYTCFHDWKEQSEAWYKFLLYFRVQMH